MLKVSSLISAAVALTIEQAGQTLATQELFLKSSVPSQVVADNSQSLMISNIDINSVAPCQYVSTEAFYSLDGIVNNDESDNSQLIWGLEVPGTNITLDFNFCEQPLPTEGPCTADDAYAFVIHNDTNTCSALRNPDSKSDTFALSTRDPESNKINGISLNFRGDGTQCALDPTQPYWLQVNITCREDSRTLQRVGDPVTNGCQTRVEYLHESGCPVFTLDAFTQFINKYAYLMGAALILLGVFLVFFGNKFVNLVIFTVVALAVMVVLGSIFFSVFLKDVKEDWAKWLSFAAIVAVSGVCGWIVMRMRKWGIGIVAGWGGVMLGFMVVAAFVVKNVYAYYAILIGFAVAAFYLAVKIEKTVIILMTAFIGSYVLVRGVSMYVGGFPSETELRAELADGVIDWDNYDKKFYIYLGAILLSTILGTMYQKKKEEELEKSLSHLKRPIR